jgi:hypothetical protein
VRIDPSLEGWGRLPPLEVRQAVIRPIPVGGARVIVTIDGQPYAGFLTRACAEDAVRLWMGEVNGIGIPVPPEQQTACGWHAIRGHVIEVVER